MQNSLLIPPGLEPIAYILYDGDYKTKLTQLVRNAPKNIADDANWWKQLRLVTGASKEEIVAIRDQHVDLATEKMQKTGKVFNKLADTPVMKSDPELQKLIKVFSQNMLENNKNVAELLDLQKKVQTRIAKLDEIIRQKEIELAERKQKNKPVTESKELILEGFLSKTISKVRQYLASDAFKSLIGLGEDGDEMAQLDAKTIVRDTLQVVCDKAYKKLEGSGIDRRMLMKAYRKRNDKSNLAILDKARKIITGKDAPVEATIVEPQKGPPPIKAENMKLEKGPPPVQTTQNAKGPSPKPHNEISMMKQMIDQARKKARAGGMDEFQAAENLLQKFEEKGVDDAPIVRRMWEKYRAERKATRP